MKRDAGWNPFCIFYPSTMADSMFAEIFVCASTMLLTATLLGLIAALDGCTYAYNLDGGGSATLYFNGKVMNKLIGNTQRPCADFLYFTR